MTVSAAAAFEHQHVNAAFLRAATDNDVPRMKDLHAQGASINKIGKGGKTALMSMVQNANAEGCAFLIAHQAAVDHQDDDGNTSVHFAAVLKDPACLHLLLTAQAKPDLQNAKNETPAFTCIAPDTIENLRALISAGAAINQRDPSGNTLLIAAELHGRKAMANALLDMGADHSLKGYKNETVAVIAARSDDWETTLRLINDGADLSERGRSSESIVALARKADAADVIKAAGEKIAACFTEGTDVKLKPVRSIRFKR